jgi:molybdopterin synthase catalytic subunit
MTEKAIAAIVEEARGRWEVLDCTVIHRVAELRPTDQIVLVAVASGHRADAFAACEFIMDYLKTRAPFWKKEATPEGARWVEARSADDSAAERWAEPRAERGAR